MVRISIAVALLLAFFVENLAAQQSRITQPTSAARLPSKLTIEQVVDEAVQNNLSLLAERMKLTITGRVASRRDFVSTRCSVSVAIISILLPSTIPRLKSPPGLMCRSRPVIKESGGLLWRNIGGGFPAHYDDTVPRFKSLAKTINTELNRLFPAPIEILAEPGRFLVASAATAVAQIIGKAVRGGKLCYYLNDGVYHTYSGVIFDHCQYHLKSFRKSPTQICSVFGPTCDALDTISLAEELPDMELGELVYAENMGAYAAASSTFFNGFPPAKVVHVNQ